MTDLGLADAVGQLTKSKNDWAVSMVNPAPLTAVMWWYGLQPPSCGIWTGPAPFRSNPPMFFRAISALQMTEVLRFCASSQRLWRPRA
jgi:hypothetical protein